MGDQGGASWARMLRVVGLLWLELFEGKRASCRARRGIRLFNAGPFHADRLTHSTDVLARHTMPRSQFSALIHFCCSFPRPACILLHFSCTLRVGIDLSHSSKAELAHAVCTSHWPSGFLLGRKRLGGAGEAIPTYHARRREIACYRSRGGTLHRETANASLHPS